MANLRVFCTLLFSTIMIACAPGERPAAKASPRADTLSAAADLLPVRRSEVRGMVRFRVTDHGLRVKGQVAPLPHGRYGFAIHENGDCSSHDGKSAGGYFQGTKGAPPLGRLDDLVANEQGVAAFQRAVPRLSLDGPNGIIGKALVVHAWPYDPDENIDAVPFLACGVIRGE